jgi:hypothetical protein
MSRRGKVFLILGLGLLAASQSGNPIRLGGATHPVAIAARRCAARLDEWGR